MPLINMIASTGVGRRMLAPLVRAYQQSICKELAKVGLRAEDLIRIKEMGSVGEQALALLPEHAQQARVRRLIRAQDLCNKHLHLTDAQQRMQQPLKQELAPIIRHVQQRELERKTYV